MIDKHKYITFKREDFYTMMGQLALPPGSGAPDDMDCAPHAEKIQRMAEALELNDAVVVRKRDMFASIGLYAYAHAVQSAVEIAQMVPTALDVEYLTDLADFFAGEAESAAQMSDKVPD